MSRDAGLISGGFQLLKTPDAPTGLSITPGIGSLTVNFTAPSNTGDGAITSYVASAVNESTGASVGVSGSASPLTITESSGTFKVRVQAYNVYGPGRLTEYSTGNAVYVGATLWSWGKNTSGQLGINNVDRRSSPTQVGALTTWRSADSGQANALIVKTDGTLWTVGRGDNGQIGTNSLVSQSSPVQIGALTNWSSVSCGRSHSAAIKTDGTLWTWGDNTFGQLGLNDTNLTGGGKRSSPTQVGALTDWKQAACAYRATIVVKTDGTIWSWGSAEFGKLGQNNVVYRSSPVQIGALTNWNFVAAKSVTVAAIKTDNTLWTWGNNSYGALGLNIGTTINRSSPTQVGTLTNWSLASIQDSCSAVKTDGTLWSWGSGQFGRLGLNDAVYRSSPVQVGTLSNWAKVSVWSHCIAIKSDNTMWTWGANGDGELGINNVVFRSSPVQVGALTGWIQPAAGEEFSVALYGSTT